MFRDKQFRRRKWDDICRDIDMLRQHHTYVESIFLIDGNVMIMPTACLLQVFEKIRATFPEVRNISLYSGLHDLRRRTSSELEELKAAGKTTAYAGLETGGQIVL